ncbi:hypothetical protein Tco_1110505 [Tanacetum coccineum]|uniref:Uncharacterized protein n=1 Tax=Tanacetum coccineum TaxID=301880 RepID=A0ABQ5ILE3_9ASTR
MHGPYVRRMIPEPGDIDREVPVAETFHEQTDEELTEKEVKQMMVRGNGGNQFRQYAGQNVGNQNGYNAVQNNGNGVVIAARAEGNGNGNNGNQIRYYNCRGMGHLTRNYIFRLRRRDVDYLQIQLLIAQKEEAGIKLQAEEFDLMAATGDLDEIEEVNANCILMANLQQVLTPGTQTDKAPVYDSNGNLPVVTLIYTLDPLSHKLEDENVELEFQVLNYAKENAHLKTTYQEHVDSKIQSPVIDMVLLQKDTQTVRGVESTAKTRRPQPSSNTKKDMAPSASKRSCIKNKDVEVEEHHRNLPLSKNKKHMSSECNNVKITIEFKSKVVCAYVTPLKKGDSRHFLQVLGHSGENMKVTDVNVNKLKSTLEDHLLQSSTNVSLVKTILRCLVFLELKILMGGMYNNKKVDYAYLLWEDFIYQIENKNMKKGNAMYYPRFTKLTLFNCVMAKDPSILRKKQSEGKLNSDATNKKKASQSPRGVKAIRLEKESRTKATDPKLIKQKKMDNQNDQDKDKNEDDENVQDDVDDAKNGEDELKSQDDQDDDDEE